MSENAQPAHGRQGWADVFWDAGPAVFRGFRLTLGGFMLACGLTVVGIAAYTLVQDQPRGDIILVVADGVATQWMITGLLSAVFGALMIRDARPLSGCSQRSRWPPCAPRPVWAASQASPWRPAATTVCGRSCASTPRTWPTTAAAAFSAGTTARRC